ncbi:hypothetical protein ACLOJK_022981, partial [Asimina triloba]
GLDRLWVIGPVAGRVPSRCPVARHCVPSGCLTNNRALHYSYTNNAQTRFYVVVFLKKNKGVSLHIGTHLIIEDTLEETKQLRRSCKVRSTGHPSPRMLLNLQRSAIAVKGRRNIKAQRYAPQQNSRSGDLRCWGNRLYGTIRDVT